MHDHDERVQAFFKGWSQTYDDPSLQDAVYRPLQEVMHRRLRVLRASLGSMRTILDAGVGTGQALPGLRELADNVIGIDPSGDMLRHARTRLPDGGGLLRASATELPLANASVDACVSCFSIHWWPDVLQGFSELHRVLRPGGVALIMIPTTALLALGGGVQNPGQLVHWKPPSWYARLARDAGFTTRLPKEVARGAWLLECTRGGN